MPSDPGRATSAIDAQPDPYHIPFNGIVDGEGEAFRKGAVEVEIGLVMHPAVDLEAFNVGIKVGEKISAEPGFFAFIETVAFDEVFLSKIKKLNPHWMAAAI